MQISVFGATGRSGLPLIKELLEQGFVVNALVRDPDKLGIYKDQIKYITGNIEEINKVEEVIKNSDCVVSVIGHTKNSKKDMQLVAIKNIILLMNKYSSKRLIVLTGAGVLAQGDKPGFIDKLMTLVLKTVSKNRIVDGINYVEEVMKSNLDWTVVRVPMLNLNPVNNTYKVGMVGDKNLGFKLSRNDLAKFLVSIISDKSYFHKLPYVANIK